jgi:hypothetical protein
LACFVAAPLRDHRNLIPVGDAEFAVYRALYRYDPVPLEGRVDSVGGRAGHWHVEHVSFAATYGNERVPALLYLPSGGSPPYQTVVFAPGSEPCFGPQPFRDANGQRQCRRAAASGQHSARFFFPLETAQEPMFRLLGTPAKDKRHRVFESGHLPFQWAEVVE